MAKQWLSWWMVYAATLVFLLISAMLPFVNVFFAPVFVVGLVLIAKKMKILKPFNFVSDITFSAISTFLFLGAVTFMAVFTLSQISWIEIIVIGAIADGVAFVLGFVPVLGDVASSIINFLIIYYALPGFLGFFIGTIVSIISLIPLHIPLSITVTMVALKATSLVFGGIFS